MLILCWGRRGGGPRYALEIVRVLAKCPELEIHLSLSRQSQFHQDFEGVSVAGRFDIDTYETILQFGLRTLLWLPVIQHGLKNYIQRKKIDIVFCTMDHIWGSLVSGSIKNSDAAYLLTVHDATRHPGEDQHWRRWLLKRDIHASDSVVVLTRAVGKLLEKKYVYPADRIFLSAHGRFGDTHVATEPRSFPVGRGLRILFFGRILEYKGLDLILSALMILRDEFPSLQLEVWGEGDISPYSDTLEAIGNVRVENRWIEEGEISYIFHTTDLCVLPYKEASQSGVIPTAYAFGMPCITTPIPGLSEQVINGETGIVSSGFSPDEFAEAIAIVLRNPELYACMSRACIDAAKSVLSWDVIGQSVRDLLFCAHIKGKRKRWGYT